MIEPASRLEVSLSAHALFAAAGYCYVPMGTTRRRTIDVERLLALAGRPRMIVASEVIFSQGDQADSLMYVKKGLVKVSVSGRREVVAGILGLGDYFGEECLTRHATRQRTATAITRGTVVVIGKAAIEGLLRAKPGLARRFLTHLLSRRMQIEDDLIAQLRSSCEQRLARTLLILAGYGHHHARKHIVPRMSQAALADIVGSTRSRINGLLHKFERRGFIEIDGSLIVHRSLLSVLAR